jgi:PqqD family protein of HPr-rel-A system
VDVDGDVVILERGSGDLHLLDVTAAAVWRRLDTMSGDELVAALAVEFGAEPAVVRADVEELLRRLQDRGLVQAVLDG